MKGKNTYLLGNLGCSQQVIFFLQMGYFGHDSWSITFIKKRVATEAIDSGVIVEKK